MVLQSSLRFASFLVLGAYKIETELEFFLQCKNKF